MVLSSVIPKVFSQRDFARGIFENVFFFYFHFSDYIFLGGEKLIVYLKRFRLSKNRVIIRKDKGSQNFAIKKPVYYFQWD